MLLPFIANFFVVRFTQDQVPVVQRIFSLNSKLFAKILTVLAATISYAMVFLPVKL